MASYSNYRILTIESSSKESEKSALREELDKQKSENDTLRQQIQELLTEKEELSPYMVMTTGSFG